MAALARALPAPIYTSTEEVIEAPLPAAPTPSNIPKYGSRKGWKPKTAVDFNGGGAYPECHVAQYPLDMGRKKPAGAGSTLALQVDQDGTVRYDAIAQYGRAHGSKVQSSFKGKFPLSRWI
jgi:SNW domain-containing protein 1